MLPHAVTLLAPAGYKVASKDSSTNGWNANGSAYQNSTAAPSRRGRRLQLNSSEIQNRKESLPSHVQYFLLQGLIPPAATIRWPLVAFYREKVRRVLYVAVRQVAVIGIFSVPAVFGHTLPTNDITQTPDCLLDPLKEQHTAV